jgi:acetyl esterase/lipase
MIVLSLAAASPRAASAQAPAADPRQSPVVYRLPGMEKADVRAGVVFDGTVEPPLALDAYRPPGLKPGERRPAVVFVGGAERSRDWRWAVSLGQLAAASGVVGIVADKRYPRGFEGTRAGFADTEKLLAFLRSHGELGIDPERICLWTFSAGGRLAAVGLQPGGPAIRCLVAFYSVLDLTPELSGAGEESERAALLRRYSPLQALAALADGGKPLPALFVARAGRDAPNTNGGIERFVAAALRLNVPLTVMNYPGGVHGFDLANDTPESRAILAAALGFIREQTGAP